MDLKALRRKITRIRHDSYLFAGTIRENLLMGKEDATETQMKEALREVNLLDFVEKAEGWILFSLRKRLIFQAGRSKGCLLQGRFCMTRQSTYLMRQLLM